MKVLAIQLKRIGDVILTTPALTALAKSGASVTLLVDSGCASLLPAIKGIDEKLVHTKRRGNRPLWRRLRADGWDTVLDFTGNDRSAVMSWFSGARRRITFESVRSRWWKRLVYHEYADSPVRMMHTQEHYLNLARKLGIEVPAQPVPSLHLTEEARQAAAKLVSAAGLPGRHVLVHPGTARPEKYWPAENWGEIVARLRTAGFAVAITCGPDAFEQKHARELMLVAERLCSSDTPPMALLTPPTLLEFAAVVEGSQLVLSCDTSAVHFAAAFARPQVSIFGPTNPFHWRPTHAAAVVLSAAFPRAELTEFRPKMKGAPTSQLPVQTVWAAAERLLPPPASASASEDTT